MELLHPSNLFLIFVPSLISVLFWCKIMTRQRVFLVDFACYKPPKDQQICRQTFIEKSSRSLNSNKNTLEFMDRILQRVGLGEKTYISKGLLKEPPDMSAKAAKEEVEMAIFGAIDELLLKTGVQCEDIDILVTVCGVYNIMPSLSSVIVKRYNFRHDIHTYNITGMGCTAGLVALGLVQNLLKVHDNSCALVVTSDSITENVYKGNDRSKLLTNCIFRVGAVALLLSNKPSDLNTSKYELIHTVRSQTSNDDRSYNCIFMEEDVEGHRGITINKDLLYAAMKTIRLNISTVAPLVLSLSEKLRYLVNLIAQYFHMIKSNVDRPYNPDFSKTINHFFPHVGGKPVLDDLQKKLGFSDEQMEASRMTLYRFGNTSTCSVWYEVAYVEAKGRVRKGDTLWQIAFGSGFKCTSVIWRANRSIDRDEVNPWSDEVDEFPVDLSQMETLSDLFVASK
ncbi:3-ketoacyl-CoA synthase 2-like [Solanum pennellii]|uniref:3-ketoacyl-CoA synthase n=1 Tax=Solanum pennellii TaxID=28526 RepID=A0ABM1HLV3_SOLPN|nr:3-ketoacyl-CoA synthase 2-like [Solanum pennellii]XP_015087427.1 3-ketoacyl-CoA synthase 2-like [Solanum pennellii]